MTTDSRQPILLTDPDRFMKIVTTDDPEERIKELGYFDDIALCEIIRYGVYNDEDMVPDLAEFYREMMMKAPEESRIEIYRHVAGMVENTTIVSVNAFLPFIAEDTFRGVVATAVIDYASLGPLTNEDPMSCTNDIIGMIKSGNLKNEGAAFGGLLNLGDTRICDLLAPIRNNLGWAAVSEATKCSTGFAYSATAEFYLEWLEGLSGDGSDGLFGNVASGLLLLKKTSQEDQIYIGQRPFPAREITGDQWDKMRTSISIEEYLERVASRFFALEASEAPPRVMPHVLTEWGLVPRTDPLETYQFDDSQ